MKAMLIIDMPKDCCECDFEEYRKDYDWGDGEYCQINGGQCSAGSRPGHCPLLEIPEARPSELDKMKEFLAWCECTGNEINSQSAWQEWLDQMDIADNVV